MSGGVLVSCGVNLDELECLLGKTRGIGGATLLLRSISAARDADVRFKLSGTTPEGTYQLRVRLCRRDIDHRADVEELGKRTGRGWVRPVVKVEDEEDPGPSDRRDIRQDDGRLLVIGVAGDKVVEGSVNLIGLPSGVDAHAAPDLSHRVGLDIELGDNALRMLASMSGVIEIEIGKVLTELAPAAPQSHGQLRLLGRVDVPDGTVGGNNFPSNDAL